MSDAILVVQIVGAVEGLALLAVAAVALAHAGPLELSLRTLVGGLSGACCAAAVLCASAPIPLGVVWLLAPSIVGPGLVIWSRQPCAPGPVRSITGWGGL